MKKTFFRPSIHGWPFRNSFTKSFIYDLIDIDMGFCGGMCWEALDRFYKATRISRDLPEPTEGDPIFETLWNEQLKSLISVPKILIWQKSPDTDHRFWFESQGKKTHKEWPAIKRNLDMNRPVTLTLIASSNDYNPYNLKNNHRVVAYAYEQSTIVRGENTPIGASSKVTIWVYDPNYPYSTSTNAPDCDEIKLTFYLGADNHKINLNHSEAGNRYHGLFKDDKSGPERQYKYNNRTSIKIEKCDQINIKTKTMAECRLNFSWKCKVIPFFDILIEDESWKYNGMQHQSKYKFQPSRLNNKQCESHQGNLSVILNIPRKSTKIKLILLADNNYTDFIEINMGPVLKCLPYVHKRANRMESCIADCDIPDEDLFIENATPTEDELEKIEHPIYRWIMICPSRRNVNRTNPNEMTSPHYEVYKTRRLGNVKAPVLANFLTKNLVPPITISGTIEIEEKIENKTLKLPAIRLNNLNHEGQKIFNGFEGSSDYEKEKKITFKYEAKDQTGLIHNGMVMFFAKSIIQKTVFIENRILDPAKIAQLEAIAQDLIERGLVDIAIDLPTRPPKPGLDFPRRNDISKNLRNERQLNSHIEKTIKLELKDKKTWNQIYRTQTRLLSELEKDATIQFDKNTHMGSILEATDAKFNAIDNSLNAIAINFVVDRCMNKLKENRDFLDKLKRL
jgi:hypothetical protein